MGRWTRTRRVTALLTAVALPGLAAAGYWAVTRDAGHERPTSSATLPANRTDAPAVRSPDDRLQTGSVVPADRGEILPADGEPAAGSLAALEEFDPPSGPLADRAVAEPVPPEVTTLKAVIEAYRRGDLPGGDALARTLPEGDARILAEWLALRLAPTQAGFRRITAFIAAHPGYPTQPMLRRRAEEALLAERRPPAAMKAFFADQPPQTVLGRIALARILAAEGKAHQAGAMIREAWRRDDFGPEFEARILEAFPRLLTPTDHRIRAERFLADSDWTDALRAAGRAGDDVLKLIRARIAAARNAGDAPKLVEAIPKPLQDDPGGVLARAQSLRKKDKAADAAKLVLSQNGKDPGPVAAEAWWDERRALARKLLDSGDAAGAYAVASGMPPSSGAVRIESEFHAGWIALRFLGKPEVAARHFAAAGAEATTPISRSRAAYWQGRAAEAQAQPAQEHYERAAVHATTYYGQLARARLGQRDLPVRRPEAGADDEPPAVQAVRLLYAAGARELAMPLLIDLAQRGTDAGVIAAAADAAAAAGDTRGLVAAGKAAVQRGLPLDSHAFPVGGLPAGQLPADGVETPLVFAIARQESSFDPFALSPAGARGLMQLMPATAKQTASRVGVDFALERLTSDPAYNAMLGASHLGDLVEEWKGSYILTIAAYNAGSGNVKKWIEAYGDPRQTSVDAIDWVERIPFYETRNYVQRVMENLQVYRSRLGHDQALLIDTDLLRGAVVRRDAAR